jgi:methyl-accepting chemotaxis protein
MNLRGISIGARLGMAFALNLALLALVVVGGNVMSDAAMTKLTAGQAEANAKSEYAATMRSAIDQMSIAMRNIGLHSDVKAMAEEQDHVQEQRKRYADARDALVKLGLDDAEKRIVDEVARIDKEIEDPLTQAIGQSLNFNTEAAAQVITTKIDPLTRRSIEAIGELVKSEQAAARQLLVETSVAETRRHAIAYAAGAVAMAIALLLAFVITRSITAPMKFAVVLARRVAAGDLTSEVRVDGKDETAQLMGALREMNAALARIVAQVRSRTELISTSSEEISRGSEELSARTEEQATSLEETASSMEQLTSAVRQNADNAKQANELAIGASSVAGRGGDKMREVVATINGVAESSRRIADIIGVIDGIAFQTNILALNAAVEAARAGEHGRGFAVVASEVRALAQRTAVAAKEIKDLIQGSVQRVQQGVTIVEDTGRTMAEMVEAARRVTEIMSNISLASQEQLSGIQQVGSAITQMDRVTQQNASLVGESAAAATSMAAQAAQLVQVVASFRVRDEAARGIEAPARLVEAPRPPSETPPVAPAIPPKARPAPARAALALAEEEWQQF